VSVHHSGFGVNGGPLKDRLQTTKMFHSLVMYYLHTSLLKAAFTNVKGTWLHFVVCLKHCWPKSNIAPLLEVTDPLDLLAELLLQAILKCFSQNKPS